MTQPLVIQVLEAEGYELFHTGSRMICEKPPEDSDDDWVVLYEDGLNDILENAGYVRDEWTSDTAFYKDAIDRTPIGSWRRKKVNIVVTSSDRFFTLTKLATDIAKALHIKTRAERVALFHAVRAGEITSASDWQEEIPF